MIKVGCCGFPTSMKNYFETFSLVELNTTFYQYPRINTVEGWRVKAPRNFEFTVKAHQDISHEEKLKLEAPTLEAIECMKQICRILNAKIILVQTPGSFRPDRLVDAERFFEAVNREGLIPVWETRGPAWETSEVRKKLREILEKFDVVHVTDPFRVMPAYAGEIAYFRLHGLGKQMYYYQHSDVELQRLKGLIAPFEEEGKDVYVFFNNLSMFQDGIRFMEYLSRGAFPRITASTGLSSIKEVAEKTRYPISKSMLIKRLGWRLVEVEHGKQIRLETLLTNLPSKTYESVEKLVGNVKATWKIL
jgi:uncharacterized protein YecE (DUF72 family)